MRPVLWFSLLLFLALPLWAEPDGTRRVVLAISVPQGPPDSPLEALPKLDDDGYQQVLREESTGDPKQALKLVESLPPATQSLPRTVILHAQILAKLNRLAEGEKLLREKLTAPGLDPVLAAAFEEALGDLLLRAHHFTRAVEAYAAAWPDFSKPISNHFVLKDLYAHAGDADIPTAQKMLLKLQPLDQVSPAYYFGKAAIDHCLGREPSVDEDVQVSRTIYGVVQTDEYLGDYLQIFSPLKNHGPSALAHP